MDNTTFPELPTQHGMANTCIDLWKTMEKPHAVHLNADIL